MIKLFSKTVLGISLMTLVACGGATSNDQSAEDVVIEAPKNIRYGVIADDYMLESSEIQMGQTMGALLNKYGVSYNTIDKLERESRDIFPLKKIRGGNKYTLFLREDSLGVQSLDYMSYEQDNINYVLFGFVGDSVSIATGKKTTRAVRMNKEAIIN